MKVRYLPGQDIVLSDADVMVITVNCVGVMGKGVALSFRNFFPAAVRDYQSDCRTRRLRPGGCVIRPIPGISGRSWAALATKDHWRDPSKIEWVKSGLAELARLAPPRCRIALPPPGCGNGGLDWAEVEPIVLDTLRDFDLDIYAATSRGPRLVT